LAFHGEHLGGEEQAGPARAVEVGRVQTDVISAILEGCQ
jgi:hypothetical protein